MARRAWVTVRRAWEDRYHTPTVSELVGAVGKPQCDLLEWVRQQFRELDGVRELVVWQGIPWRWSLTYSVHRNQPWVYLVPQPGKPAIAIPLSQELAAEVAAKKFSKAIKDAVALAPLVGSIRWVQCDLTARTQGEDLVALARRAYEDVLMPAAQSA
jgi:hypothetical protein